MKKINALVLLLAMTLSACQIRAIRTSSEETRVPESVMKEEAKAALESLKQAYAEKNTEKFFHFVSDEAYFSGIDLKTHISRDFSDFSQIDLNLFVDSTLIEKNKVIFQSHWQKRQVNDQTGRVETSEGKADLVFKQTSDEKPKLVDIRGQSPFES